MSRLLVIGKSGQVAQALAANRDGCIVCAGRDRADLGHEGSLRRVVEEVRPRAVINTGAYTSVDGAETDREAAAQLNVTGPAALAAVCDALDVPLIHLSTDCVFDGKKDTPYLPSDQPRPLSHYGQTKLDGELAVRRAAPRSLVVRVSWIFSEFGNNFVRTMLSLAQTRSSITVVCDQVGCPTYAPALAAALVRMADRACDPDFDAWGTYHLAGAGETDRASMAALIFEASRRHGGPSAEVVPVRTADYPTPADRPLNARLDMSETSRVFGLELPDWRLGLDASVGALLGEMRTA